MSAGERGSRPHDGPRGTLRLRLSPFPPDGPSTTVLAVPPCRETADLQGTGPGDAATDRPSTIAGDGTPSGRRIDTRGSRTPGFETEGAGRLGEHATNDDGGRDPGPREGTA